MKFRTKLFAGFGTNIILLVVFSIIVLRMFLSIDRDMHDVVDGNYSKAKLAVGIRWDINTINTETSELLLDTDTDQVAGRSKRIEDAKTNLSGSLDKLGEMLDRQPDERQLLEQLKQLHDAYVDSNDKAIELLLEGKKDEAIQWHNDNTEPISTTLSDDIGSFDIRQEQDMDHALARSTDTYNVAIRLTIALFLVSLLFGVMVALWVFRGVTRPLNHIIHVMKKASIAERNDRLPRIKLKTEDEMASIGHAYNIMATVLEEHAKSQQRANLQLQEQNWNKTKVAEITAMYQGVQTVGELAQIFIAAVAPAIEANYGVFYHRKEMENGAPRLVRSGAYAASRSFAAADGFAFGEGLAGQCAAENRVLVLDNPPPDYIRIGSGLGEAAPAQIVIVPIPFENKVVAVAEFASFSRFTQAHLDLLDELADILGITLTSVAGHMQIQQLLSESQLYTEELQTQSEELQLQQEELRTLNEQLRDQIEASERKSSELEKIREVLEERNKEILLASGYKTEFLTNMSHELRTPLNSLLILSQMLASNHEGNLTSKQVEYSQTIYSSGQDLLGLINEVLDLSKIESGKLEVVFDWVKLRRIADFAERQFEPIAVDKGLQFHARLDEEIADLMIHTDEQRLQQILQNLLANAFKFTDQGSVTLEMRMVSQERSAGAAPMLSDMMLAISVIDTGIGIAKDKQGVIFEAFRQADGTTSRKYGGTGLGLSICQKIAQLLDGAISVESEESVGSTFTLYLPFSKVRGELLALSGSEAAAALDPLAPDKQEVIESQADVSLEGKKILLVDDDLRNIYALTTALEAHKLQVLFAENGQEGIELLREQSDIDLVIMDIMMPRMDGYAAIREIRKQERFAELPIIALTAKAMKHDREKCIEAGANDYISKPILMDQLLSLIRVWLYR